MSRIASPRAPITLVASVCLALAAWALPGASALAPTCDADLDKVECYGYCRVSYLDSVAVVHAHCLNVPIGEPSPIPQEFGLCHVGGERVECYGYCRLNYVDAGGLVHGHCLGEPILE